MKKKMKKFQRVVAWLIILALMIMFVPLTPQTKAASLKDAKDTLSGMNSTVMTANVAAGGTVLSVATTTGFAVGDWFLINDGSNNEIASSTAIDTTALTITIASTTTWAFDVDTRIMELSDITHTITFTNETAIPDLLSMDLVFGGNFVTDNGTTTGATIGNVSGLPTSWTLTGQGATTLSYATSTAEALAADTSISFTISGMQRQPDGTTSNEYPIEIQLKDGDGDIIDRATVWFNMDPGITVSATVDESLTMTIGGLASGDVTTTAYTIPFATLSDGTAVTGDMQITIASNATDGYSLMLEGDSALLSDNGDAIAAVLGTNATPLVWATVDSSNTSDYGYTTSDADAGGGDWTSKYAALSGTAYEIGDNSGPTAGATNDAGGLHVIEFKVEIDTMHPAGDYYSTITFSVIPQY